MILLTTHFMDEADILADRKAIMSEGTLKCFGTSLFLKNKFGVGYHMTMVLEPQADLSTIRNLIESEVPGARENRLFGRELSYVLPRSQLDKFPDLFAAMEKNKSETSGDGIDSYGVSMTTLEEIFLKLGQEEEAKKLEEENKNKSNGAAANGTSNSVAIDAAAKDLGGFSFEAVETHKSSWQMFKALLFINWVRKYREGMALSIQFFFPLLYVVVGLSVVSINSFSVVQDKPYAITNDIYKLHAMANQLSEYSFMDTGKIRANNFIGTLNGTVKPIHRQCDCHKLRHLICISFSLSGRHREPTRAPAWYFVQGPHEHYANNHLRFHELLRHHHLRQLHRSPIHPRRHQYPHQHVRCRLRAKHHRQVDESADDRGGGRRLRLHGLRGRHVHWVRRPHAADWRIHGAR